MDTLLEGIELSLASTKQSVAGVVEKLELDQVPGLVLELYKKLGINKAEGVSLLSLKNQALLSYLSHVVLITLSHLERLETLDEQEVEEIKLLAVKSSIVQRACLEKGVKPLEKRLNYQLDKMVRTFVRMESEEAERARKLDHLNNDNDDDNDGEKSHGEDSEPESDSDEDKLAYKPDRSALAKLTDGKAAKNHKSNDKETSGQKYNPPKISAIAPPKVGAESKRAASTKKLQSMEEYLRENSDMPEMDASIGSSIVDNGRSGVKSAYDRNKEREIQRYEEENFTRLPNTMTKKTAHQKNRDMVNNFAGEDWSLFNNNRNLSETSRKRKPKSAWDKVKKRRS